MRFFILIGGIILLATTVASEMPPSPFAGKWHTRTSQVTHKSGITVNIMEREQRLSGTVVLVNPDASEIELPILNVTINGYLIEFETHDKNDTFHWSLTLKKNRDRALLHGSCREMLIDEPVRRKSR